MIKSSQMLLSKGNRKLVSCRIQIPRNPESLTETEKKNEMHGSLWAFVHYVLVVVLLAEA